MPSEEMEMAPFGRALTAMITPFTEAGELDYDRVWSLARYLTDHGSDGLVVTGTTGESPTLTAEEKVALYRTVVEAVEGREVMVVAGTGTYNTAESVHLSQEAARAGCHGILAVTPYYNRPSQEGLVGHFTAIADATDLPVMLYNIPGRTARRIEVETLKRLAAHPHIVATKDAVMDLEFTSQTCHGVPDLAVYSGQDSLTLPMMAVGAVGVVSVISHLAGDTVRQMVDAAHGGDLARARQLHHQLLPLVPASEATLAEVKEALGSVQGL